MLQRLMTDPASPSVPITEASFPAPFAHSLEYSSPARGTWNIVHTGMLVPEAHQIYICAAGCLRGVILTAAEMGLMGRFSTLELREQDLVGTDSEAQIIEGVTDILTRLPYTPRAVLVFTVCTHHFLGCNLEFVYAELDKRFPTIAFARCYMDPIRQTHAPAPEETLRQGIYGLLVQRGKAQGQAPVLQVIGNNFATHDKADFVQLAKKYGYSLRELPRCRNYEEFQRLAEADINVFISPLGRRAAQDLERRFGQPCLYLPAVWRGEEITPEMAELERMLQACDESHALGMPVPGRRSRIKDFNEMAGQADKALHEVAELLDGAPVALDYAMVTRPLSLACRLVEAGFNLTRLYVDGFLPEEQADFCWLQANCPQLAVYPTKHAVMRLAGRGTDCKLLALGQKAAYFTQSPYFVNLVENGGLWGYSGLLELARLMREAWLTPKDIRREVSRKGLGGPCCL